MYVAVPAADTFYLTGPGYTSKALEKPATMSCTAGMADNEFDGG
jgi:hypothetical protein